MAVDGPFSRGPGSVRRLFEGRSGRSAVGVGPLSRGRAFLPARRFAGGSRALEAFTKARTDHPSLELAWTYLGDTYFALDDLAAAKVAYERSLAAYPRGRSADRARYGLARTLAAFGEPGKALSLFDQLLKKGSPEWVDRCWLQIGLIHESAGRLADAVGAFRTLETATPASRTEARSPASPRACPGRAQASGRGD